MQIESYKGYKELTDVQPDDINEDGSFVLPEEVTAIGEFAFKECENLVKIEIPNTVSIIEKGAFSQCVKLCSVVLPNTIKEIERFMFFGCKGLRCIQIPDSVKVIGEAAFMDCINLKNVKISKSVVRIESYAFDDCKRLVSIELPGNLMELRPAAFSGCDSLCTVYYCGKPIPVKVFGQSLVAVITQKNLLDMDIFEVQSLKTALGKHQSSNSWKIVYGKERNEWNGMAESLWDALVRFAGSE